MSHSIVHPGATRKQEPNVIASGLLWVFAPVLAHRGALLWMNVMYFNALAVGVLYTFVDPGGQRALIDAVGAGYAPGTPLGTLAAAYVQGDVASAIGLTFLTNLLVGSLQYLLLPSLIIPFGGLLMGVGRAFLWGMLFSPVGAIWGPGILPHLGTILVEGVACIVAMLGVWIWWRPVVTTPGGRTHAWWAGLKLQVRVYVAVALLLAIGSIYEALEVIFLILPMA